LVWARLACTKLQTDHLQKDNISGIRKARPSSGGLFVCNEVATDLQCYAGGFAVLSGQGDTHNDYIQRLDQGFITRRKTQERDRSDQEHPSG
jgi:hypothetical protein